MQVSQKIEFLVYGQAVDPVSKHLYNQMQEKMIKTVKK